MLNGKLYCLGGFTDAELTGTEAVDVFDPQSNQWTSAAPMPTAATHFQGVTMRFFPLFLSVCCSIHSYF